jgi:hypothetical protein
MITHQLEFNLLALRDDPLPLLESQLSTLQASGEHSEAAEIVVKISTENSKRERWAVSRLGLLSKKSFSLTNLV